MTLRERATELWTPVTRWYAGYSRRDQRINAFFSGPSASVSDSVNSDAADRLSH